MASDYELEDIYYEVVKAATSYILRRRWYPSNNERGYIERSWRAGRKPDELVQEFVAQYGEGQPNTASTPTVLNVREIETVCPNCNLVFDVPVPGSHSG